MKHLLYNAFNNGSQFSCKTQKVCNTSTFYYAVRDLKKGGLIEPVKEYKSGEDKFWKITQRGNALIEILIQTDEMLKVVEDAKNG